MSRNAEPRRAPVTAAGRGLAAIVAAFLLGIALHYGAFVALDRTVAPLMGLRVGQSPDWLISVAQAVSWVGGGTPRWIMVILLVLLLWRSVSARSAAALAVAALLTNIVSSAMKAGFARPRPDVAPMLDQVGDLSYPSGHVSSAAVVYVLLAMMAPVRWRGAALSVAVALIICTAASRLMLGVHWLTDVFGGALLGSGVALLAAAWLEQGRAGTTHPEA